MDFTKMPNRMKVVNIDRTKLLTNHTINTEAFTPLKVVEDMLDIIPKEIWSDPKVTFLDPCCKSGIFLEQIFWRLYEGLREFEAKDWERSNYILEKQLFGLALNGELAGITRGLLYGCSKANHRNAFISTFKDEEGNIKRGFGDMKFDVVIGNPPYNKGMDLDFVKLGFDLCKQYCVMVTPAKWQTADENQRVASKNMNYRQFREQLVPHMSKVVFYPDCKDLFDIYQIDGITYYILDKNDKIDKCVVSNISKNRGAIYNSTDTRSIKCGESLFNIGNEIMLSIEHYKKFEFPVIRGTKQYNVMTNTQISGYDWFTENGPRFALGISRILDVKAGESYDGAAKTIFESDSKQECESFISWLNTRFTRFFLVPNISKLTGILCNHCFRFIPASPTGKFDHIYTDAELYTAFNLNQKYIDVIEAVIKERK